MEPDLNFEQMQRMQVVLQDKYKDRWAALTPETGRDHLLWMMIEAGEAADVIKKQGDDAIAQDGAVRRHFIEELSDVLMYLNDVAICYGITPQELAEVYVQKHRRNMERW